MRCSASEKLEIIRLVEQSHSPAARKRMFACARGDEEDAGADRRSQNDVLSLVRSLPDVRRDGSRIGDHTQVASGTASRTT